MSLLIKSLSFTYLFILQYTIFAQEIQYIISGKVIDYATLEPLGYVSVTYLDINNQSILSGTVTDEDGTFVIHAPMSQGILEVSFLGYDKLRIQDIVFTSSSADVGVIQLVESKTMLEEVIVRAEKSSTEFKLDKRVFNVGTDLSATGANVLEVLNNVPSVNVNIEGQISLRGSSGVQILINGKPSVLANDGGKILGSLTADMVDKIEVITNPSAKYEAEGTSGIINIILKKDEKRGINGSLSLNTGIPANHSLGLSLNRRSEKFNLFSQIGMGYREVPFDVKSQNTDKISQMTINTTGREYRNESFYNFILGADYYINKNNIITLSGNYAYEIEDQPSLLDFILSENDQPISSWQRSEQTEATNPKYQYELQYKRTFEDAKEHTLILSAIGNFFGKDQSSSFQINELQGSFIQPDQRTRTNFKEDRHTFNLDYTKPFSKDWKIESGFQYVLNSVGNDFAVENLINDEYIINTSLTNNFIYSQNVFGAYVTSAFEGQYWGIKIGLRAENTDLNTELVNTNESNSQYFTNIFPSLHTSYKLSDNISFQAGYSKRIFRPRLWDLNPFFNIRNNFSIRAGNPNLLPEFTDAYEAGAIYIKNDFTFNVNMFYRYTTDVVERVATFEDNVSIVRPYNIGKNNSGGIEINGKYAVHKNITINGDFNINYFKRTGSFEATRFDFSAQRWESKLITKIKLPSKIDFEITGAYESDFQTVQGTVSGFASADMGLRKKILKGRGVFNISIRDIFASRVRESIIDQPFFYAYSWGRRGRFITLGFSFGFGKGEAMQYSGSRRW